MNTTNKIALTIRPARPGDCPLVEQIARAAYAPYVARIGKEPAPMVADFAAAISKTEMDVVEIDGSVGGFAVHFNVGDHHFLENIAVHPDFQGTGAGRVLLRHVETRARFTPEKAIELYTNVMMYENLTLYGALGYMETGRKREDGFDRVYFRKGVE